MAPSERSEENLPRIEVSFPDQNFEGPLDLLLALIQKHELDILNIPIAFVTEKYLEFIRVMQLMNLDLASEYLVMAATLAHIKSKMLLPQVPADQEGEGTPEDEEDPREALIRRLLEYQKYKLAAEQLRDRSTFGQDSFLRGAPAAEAVDPGEPPLASVPLFSLVEAFQRVLDKSRVKLTHDVVADRVSLSDRINQLVDLLRSRPRVTFEELFDGVTTREGLVITFLALLEMAKLRLTRLTQTEVLGPIVVELAEGGVNPFEAEAPSHAPERLEAADQENTESLDADRADPVNTQSPEADRADQVVEPAFDEGDDARAAEELVVTATEPDVVAAPEPSDSQPEPACGPGSDDPLDAPAHEPEPAMPPSEERP